MNLADIRQATAEPSVLTKYRIPTEAPTFPEIRTKWETRIGRVLPMSAVGITVSAKVSKPVIICGAVAVCRPTAWNSGSEKLPKRPMASSIPPNVASKGTPGRFDTIPPRKLPTPRPNIKALTTMVTDSTLMP